MGTNMSLDKIILKAEDLDGYLTRQDKQDLEKLENMYNETIQYFQPENKEKIISSFDKMGHVMQEICAAHPDIQVYSFVTEEGAHAEASRVISKLRDINTNHQEFIYYSQRAYEMLFRMAFLFGSRSSTGWSSNSILPSIAPFSRIFCVRARVSTPSMAGTSCSRSHCARLFWAFQWLYSWL